MMRSWQSPRSGANEAPATLGFGSPAGGRGVRLSRFLLNVARATAYPAVLGTAVLSGHLLIRAGFDTTLAVAGINAVAALVIFGLQRVLPFEDAWRKWREDLRVDLLHTVLSSGAVPALCKAALWGVSFQAA